jgi:hypothetical protein
MAIGSYLDEIEFESPSVRLARLEAAIGSYLELPFTTSSPLRTNES